MLLADPVTIKSRFPIFDHHPHIVFLDSAASSQKPAFVLDAMHHYYQTSYANVHRGVYELSETATRLFEQSRIKTQLFIGARYPKEIIFTSGTTFGLNLLAYTIGEQTLTAGDEILLPISEHHSNIVCWQMLAKRKGASVKFIPLDQDFRLDLKEAEKLINKKTKILSFAHISNVLGRTHPIKQLVALAKSVSAITVCDGAQGICHQPVNVQELDVDFYAFSAHKMCGPTGAGVLYGRKELLESMEPFLGGGDMIKSVTTEGSSWATIPNKFEAGTPGIAQIIGLGAAIDFYNQLDRKSISAHEQELAKKAFFILENNKHITCFTRPSDDDCSSGILTFTHGHIHPHDLASILGSEGVCVRAGHHCAQPLMKALGGQATTRVSFFMYNLESDVIALERAIHKAEKLFL